MTEAEAAEERRTSELAMGLLKDYMARGRDEDCSAEVSDLVGAMAKVLAVLSIEMADLPTAELALLDGFVDRLTAEARAEVVGDQAARERGQASEAIH